MSKWTDFRDAAEHWFAAGWHETLTVVVPEATKLGKAEMGAILAAGLAANAAGADKKGMQAALLTAATDTAKTVGMQVGLDTLQQVAGLALAHLSTTGPAGQAEAPAQ